MKPPGPIVWMLRSNLRAPREWSLRNQCTRPWGNLGALFLCEIHEDQWTSMKKSKKKSMNIYEHPRSLWNLHNIEMWGYGGLHTRFGFVGFTTLVFMDVFGALVQCRPMWHVVSENYEQQKQ
jgi:hypothetical protein